MYIGHYIDVRAPILVISIFFITSTSSSSSARVSIMYWPKLEQW